MKHSRSIKKFYLTTNYIINSVILQFVVQNILKEKIIKFEVFKSCNKLQKFLIKYIKRTKASRIGG